MILSINRLHILNQELFEDVETVVWRDEVPEKDE